MAKGVLISEKIPKTDHRSCRVNRRKLILRLIAEVLLLLVGSASFVTLPACVPEKNIVIGDPNAELAWSGPEMPNARIEIAGCCNVPNLNCTPDCENVSYHPSNRLWLRGRGNNPDPLTGKWDAYTVLWTLNRDVMCDFTNVQENTTDDNCERCNYCRADVNQCHAYTLLGSQPHVYYPTVEYFPNSYWTRPIFVDDIYFGCENATFVPPGSGTYRIVAPLFASDNLEPAPTDLLKRAGRSPDKQVVVVDAAPGSVSYQMERYLEPANPSYVWYKWSVTGDPIWVDNFSKNLRVSKVRILRGRLVLDPITRWRVEYSNPVRPSSIIMIPSFDPQNPIFSADNIRCYSDLSLDGNLNLTQCRGAANASGNLLNATPTYLWDQPTEKLTWFAEFNPCEGCGGPPCGSSCASGATEPGLVQQEVLAIEFTVERAP